MDKQIILLILQLLVAVATCIWINYVKPNIPQESIQDITAKTLFIVSWAEKFVNWAKYFLSDASGSKKMDAVIKQLVIIAEKYNIDMDENELKAIAQSAYDAMKAKDDAREAAAKKAEALTEATIVIPKVTAPSSNETTITLV